MIYLHPNRLRVFYIRSILESIQLSAVRVSHNVSRAKQDEIERRRRVAELQPYVVPGWQIDRQRWEIVEVRSVLGHFQRGQDMLLRCRRTDCHRRVEVDFRGAVHAGLGDRTTAYLIEQLKCHHWTGCQLEEVSALYPDGVPLVGYLQHKDVLIAVHCTTCGNRLLLPPAEVIKRLKTAGRGDGSTGVLKLAKAIRGPCRKCGMRLFETAVVWSEGV